MPDAGIQRAHQTSRLSDESRADPRSVTMTCSAAIWILIGFFLVGKLSWTQNSDVAKLLDNKQIFVLI
ncbi:MAG: hypothetical protein WA584_11410 [Pyrinomonadaceae bacterium]